MLQLMDLPLFADANDCELNLIEQLRQFKEFGQETIEYQEDCIPYFVNEYWTSGQRKSNSIHEISYRACFKAQLPEFFISRLTKHGDKVYDPFMGRGTTLIQTSLMGRYAIGNDINPLSKLLCRPRINPPTMIEIKKFLNEVNWNNAQSIDEELYAFYHPETLIELTSLKDMLLTHFPIEESNPNAVADWVRMVAINRLSGHSPGFFSGRSMPPNQAVSIKAQHRINEKTGMLPPYKNVKDIIIKKSKSLLARYEYSSQNSYNLYTSYANHTPEIENDSISLIVTSPPFLDIVQYSQDNWLRCWFAGIDASKINISMHKNEQSWKEMVREVLIEQARILKPGGHLAFEVGEVKKAKVMLEKLVWEAANGLPFERLGVMVNQQEFTKTANCWGISNNSAGTNTNRIVLFRKT